MLNFLKYRFVYFTLSGVVLIAGISSLILWGLRLSIDFTGGSVIQMKNDKLTINKDNEKFKSFFSQKGVDIVSMQQSGQTVTLKTKPITREKWEEVKKSLEKTYGKITELQFETVGPILGKELLEKTAYAAIFSILAMLFFIAYAFRDIKFGISAVLALIHDVLVITGFFSLFGHFFNVEIDTLFVTAVLTTMSFSVHDTIVVFDRIRESGLHSGRTLSETINRALTETISRSLNNSLTIIFMLLALTLLGGETIKWFVVALLIGTISGAYSSPFVATPILYYLNRNKTAKH